MSARTATAAVVLLAALALTGCAESATDAGDERTAPAVAESGQPETRDTETPVPVVAETDGPETSDEEQQTAFIKEVRSRLAKIRTQIPDITDEQLISLAHKACDALAPNLTGEDLSLVEGETRTNGHFMDSSAIIVAARLTMCPIEN
ncbi:MULTISPECIES: DUF732 domain-containing protein [unclassified Microbacterium]|uniref:DUF732 domain-containing protein n=1 Tax=unclassified Microbacterium TaxID=2609290 RepID=UPI000EAA86FF|nr:MULTISPECIES: DUF732 domain-containing protein [unclassified Microbacterium]MBT2485729.1 hypothetical protein [Microbacterium sp. ISL-108]RKN68497.1 hypothetical protein D7252_13500 [Microbacterium sp. CGR2]